MQGFDPRFRDFGHYLDAVEREVWDRRGLRAAMAEVYHPGVVQRGAEGLAQGPDAVLGSGMDMLLAVPDRRILTEDVIWSGTPKLGMLGSQRMMVMGHHLGDGPLGAATGRPVRYRVMADRFAKANRISDAWLVADTGALLRQIGVDLEDYAIDRLQDLDPETGPFTPELDVPGPYTGRGNDVTWGLAFEALVSALMAGQLANVADQYDPACQLSYPGGVEAHGIAAAERFWLALRQAFPSAQFTVHHRIGLEEPMMPPRAAVRWSLSGRHDGWGAFGRPTGVHVHIMGLSHAEFGAGGLRREWTLFDEAAVWMQLLRASV